MGNGWLAAPPELTRSCAPLLDTPCADSAVTIHSQQWLQARRLHTPGHTHRSMPTMRSRSRSVTSACPLFVFNEMEMEVDTGSPVCRTYPFPAVSALHSRSRPPFSHTAFSHGTCSAPPPPPQGQVRRALPSGPCTSPQAQVQPYDRARYTTAPRSIHPRFTRTTFPQSIRPDQPKWTAPHTSRKVFALDIHRLRVLVTADSRLRPCSGHTPVPARGFKLGCTMLPRTRCLFWLQPSSFLQLLPSLPSLPFRFLLSLLLVRCPRLVPYSFVPPLPSLPCNRFGNADVDDDGAWTSALQAVLGSRQCGGRPTRGVVLQSATPESGVDSRWTPRLSSPPDLFLRPARPATTSRLLPCSLLASLSYTMLSASKSGE
ncbi:hypothetical protein B0H14DRAFT_3909549 [Mycena olivaceomarginata]|nr:hypothetical protein B0H14DRAFT_3909549 [Mycena olivaceomarginata]